MDNEGLTSVAVVDNGLNVVGNISTFDVKLLTSAANAPLLQGTCMHFVSVILSEKGVEKGRDSFPVFYVTPQSTLAHTIAKLVATHSHRMWVVEAPSPSPSAPATPLLTPSLPTTTSGETTTAPGTTVVVPPPSSGSTPPSPLPGTGFASVPAAALPGVHLSGRLTGVVSLTDILNLFAKSSGLHPADPGDQRARRRTQSSSSSVRPSLDGARTTSGAIQ
jgi:CBS domain-containing protein